MFKMANGDEDTRYFMQFFLTKACKLHKFWGIRKLQKALHRHNPG